MMISRLPPLALSLAVLAIPGSRGVPAAEAASPPGAETVARRALILHALFATRLYPRRGEGAPAEMRAAFEEERRRIVRWLERERLMDSANSWERSVLETPVGELSREDGARVSAQGEGLSAVLHALGLLDPVPPYDQARGPDPAALRRLPAVGQPTAAFVRGARLRPETDIRRALETAELWHWRARTQEAIVAGKYPAGEKFKEIARSIRDQVLSLGLRPALVEDGPSLFREVIRFSAHWGHGEGMVGEPIADDFPALGKAYRDLSPLELAGIAAVARERHRAFLWLIGELKDWEAPPAAGR